MPPETERHSPPQAWVLVPAAGIGRRMGADIPKQYLTVAGRPILHHTLDRLARLSDVAGIILVLAADDTALDQASLRQLPLPVHCVTGGTERADSVLAGLDWLAAHTGPQEDPWVLVHDAARPGVRSVDVAALLAHCYHLGGLEATSAAGAILALPARDTVKKTNAMPDDSGQRYHRIADTLPREQVWLAQTPQCFPLFDLRQALRAAQLVGAPITDEASAMQLAGHAVDVVPGHWQNAKLTVPDDLPLLEWILTRHD